MINDETKRLIEQIKNDLKSELSERRYKHSVGVMERSIELADIYGIDENEAALAGLTHDIAKEIPTQESFKIAKENNINFDDVEIANPVLLHGKIGAFLAKRKYNLNENIQNAIKYHTTTDKNMNMLAKIVYVSDKTEDGRESSKYNVKLERDLANNDINQAMIYIISENIKGLLNDKRLIHPKAIETRNALIIEGNNKKNNN